MARPHKQTVDYFPHYAGASDGKTMFILQSKFGNDGYAFWFKLLELIAAHEGHYYDYRKPTDWQFLLAKTGVSADIATQILETLTDVEAIDQELNGHKIIWIQKFVDNLADLYKRRKIDFPRKPVIPANNNPVSVNNNPISTDNNPQSKVKESKVNNSKVNNSKEEETTTPLTPQDSSSTLEEIIENTELTEQDALDFYEKNIGELSEDMEGEIKLAVKRFTAEWVIDAIREAGKHNKKTWVYIAGILKNWQRFGKDTVIPPRNKGPDPDKYLKGRYAHMVKT